jgi:hypothetical protein
MSESQKWNPDKIHRVHVSVDQLFITLASLYCDMLWHATSFLLVLLRYHHKFKYQIS